MLMVGVFVLSIPIGAEAITYAKGIYLDGQLIKTEVAPVIENGRTLVPVRGVLEAMGATVTWDNKTVWTYGLFDRNKGKTIAFQIS